jgi:hypothetical protein
MLIISIVFLQTTATHQLKNAVTSVAFCGRPLLLCSLCPSRSDDISVVDSFSDLIVTSLSNALLGMDANDPPKTIATMQLIGSIFSNVSLPVIFPFVMLVFVKEYCYANHSMMYIASYSW